MGALDNGITDGTISSDGDVQSNMRYTSSNEDAIFEDYRVRCKYVKDKHVYVAGLSSPSGFQGRTAAFFQLAAPTLLLICEWTGSRSQDMPNIPNPQNADSNWVLLDEYYEPFMVTESTEGVPMYRFSGIYVYGHQNPNSVTLKDIVVPRPPWLQDVFDRKPDESLMEQGLIDQGSSGSTGSLGFL